MDPRPPDGRSWSGQAYVRLLGSAARALRLLRQLDVDACLIGGLAVSLVLTVFIVPAAYLLLHGNEATKEHPSRGSAPLP